MQLEAKNPPHGRANIRFRALKSAKILLADKLGQCGANGLPVESARVKKGSSIESARMRPVKYPVFINLGYRIFLK